MRALAVVVTAACTVPIVPTERAHIDTFPRAVGHNHSVYYKKTGITLGGAMCGEQYMRAVAGVPEAEALMRSCAYFDTGYDLGVLGFVVFSLAGVVTAHYASGNEGTALGVGFGLGFASFAAGLTAGLVAGYRLDDAVRAYNLAVDRGIEQR